MRLGLGEDSLQDAPDIRLSPDDWEKLYSLASQQAMLGIAYAGICKLPKDRQPPLDLAFQWASEAETIRGHNRMVNSEAKRLTELFTDQGRRTAILKGAANARLYPDKFMRQCGDIDIWVEGGRDSVVGMLERLGLTRPEPHPEPGRSMTYEEKYAEAKRKFAVNKHHVHLASTAASVTVEAHFAPSSGNYNPITNKLYSRYLEREIVNAELVPEGFYAPSLRFALAMQLAHIQRHFVASGIGLKQIVDYYVLLQHASDEERLEMSSNLKRFGLARTGAALMWLLGHTLGLPRERMLCAPSAYWGRRMLKVVLAGGNFGYYTGVDSMSVVPRWFCRRWRILRNFFFNPGEVFWAEVDYWKTFFLRIPVRIRLRKLSIRDLF